MRHMTYWKQTSNETSIYDLVKNMDMQVENQSKWRKRGAWLKVHFIVATLNHYFMKSSTPNQFFTTNRAGLQYTNLTGQQLLV